MTLGSQVRVVTQENVRVPGRRICDLENRDGIGTVDFLEPRWGQMHVLVLDGNEENNKNDNSHHRIVVGEFGQRGLRTGVI